MNSNTPHNEHVSIPWYQDADLLVNNFKWICFLTIEVILYCAWICTEAIYFGLNPVNTLKQVTHYIQTTELTVVTYVMSKIILKSLAFANLNLGIQMTVKIRSATP